MTAGRKPTPTALKLVKGNPGKRAKRAPSVKPQGDLVIPNYLEGDALECFQLIAGAMPPSTYSVTDTGGLAVYAVAWADHKRATSALITEPAIVAGSTGNMQPNPWFKIKNEAARIMMSMGDRLGLDPKARAGLCPAENKPKSKFAGLIGQSGATA